MEKRWQMTKEDEDKIKNALHKKLNNPRPLFTLTAEEVEIVKGALEIAEEMTASILQAIRGENAPIPKNARSELLTRIKQWQDENRTNN